MKPGEEGVTEAVADLPETRNPRHHRKTLTLPRGEARDLRRQHRTRADERHVAGKHVEELGKLVQIEATKKSTHTGDPWIPACLEHRSVGIIERLYVRSPCLRIHRHRSELEQGEATLVESDPHLSKKYRPRRVQLDRQGNEYE